MGLWLRAARGVPARGRSASPLERMNRLTVVASLVECQGDITALRGKLQEYPFDADAPLVTLQPSHIISVLERFVAGAISASDVESWADAVEGRDDIAYAEAAEVAISATLAALSAPEINGALTPEFAKTLLSQLRHAL